MIEEFVMMCVMSMDDEEMNDGDVGNPTTGGQTKTPSNVHFRFNKLTGDRHNNLTHLDDQKVE